MKKLKYIVISLLLSIGNIYGEGDDEKITIVDPTYDCSFKALFGQNGRVFGEVTPEVRLVDMLTSILKPMFKIKVKELSFKNVESKMIDRKSLVFDIFVECKCEFENDKQNYCIDVEIQKSKTIDFVDRTIVYGDRLADATTIPNEEDYSKHPKNIVLVLIDNVLPEFKYDAVFYTAPCFKKVLSINDKGREDGTPIQFPPSPTQIFIQLPLLSEVKEENDYTKNEWLKLLGTHKKQGARLCEVEKDSFSNTNVLNSVNLLEALKNDNNFSFALLQEQRQLGEIFAKDKEIEGKDKEIEEKDKVIKEQDRTIKEKDKEIEDAKNRQAESEAEIDKMNTYIRKITLRKDITKFSKTDQKESFKFAKILKNLSKEDLEKLLNDKAKKNQKVQNYLNTITQSKAEFNDNSADEENLFEDL